MRNKKKSKVIRLTERDLNRIVKKIIREEESKRKQKKQ